MQEGRRTRQPRRPAPRLHLRGRVARVRDVLSAGGRRVRWAHPLPARRRGQARRVPGDNGGAVAADAFPPDREATRSASPRGFPLPACSVGADVAEPSARAARPSGSGTARVLAFSVRVAVLAGGVRDVTGPASSASVSGFLGGFGGSLSRAARPRARSRACRRALLGTRRPRVVNRPHRGKSRAGRRMSSRQLLQRHASGLRRRVSQPQPRHVNG